MAKPNNWLAATKGVLTHTVLLHRRVSLPPRMCVCRCRAPKETGLSSHLNPYGEAGGAQTLAPVPTE